jgi:hypothetical protein
MVNLKKMSPDVLIYIQSIKQFFSANSAAQKYFDLEEGNEKQFFDNVSEISQKNYDENGEPELSVEQFEELRRKISDSTKTESEITASFMTLGNLGHISLN